MNQAGNNINKTKPMWQALSLAWELGYTIAVPLLVLVLAGRLADKWLGSSPWLLLVGVFLSIMISTWLVYHKTKVIVDSSIRADFSKKPDSVNEQKETKV